MSGLQASTHPPAGGAAHADRLRRLHALAAAAVPSAPPSTQRSRHEARTSREGDSYRFDGAARTQTSLTTLNTPEAAGAHLQAEAAAGARLAARAAGEANVGALALRGAGGIEAEGIARASAEGLLVTSPRLVAAQGTLLAEAAARLRGAAVGQAQLGPGATATGAVSVDAELVARAEGHAGAVITPATFDAQASAVAEAYARVRGEVAGELAVKDAKVVGAALEGEAVTGTRTKAQSRLHLGIDELGLPSFGIGAAAEAVSGAWSKTQAKGFASILGLIHVGASGSAEALAGLGAGLDGTLVVKDGAITLGAGAKAAAGVGGGAGATVTVGLGNLPKGILQTVGAPVLPIPGLLINTLSRGLRALTGSDAEKKAEEPGIEDLPRIVAANFSNGLTLIGKGAGEIADQVTAVGSALVDGVASLFK